MFGCGEVVVFYYFGEVVEVVEVVGYVGVLLGGKIDCFMCGMNSYVFID